MRSSEIPAVGYREGHHQRGKLANGWKEGPGDIDRLEPEQKEVELLEKLPLVTRKMAPILDPLARVVAVVVFIMATVMLTIVFGMSALTVSRCRH